MARHEIPCSDTDHDAHPLDVGHADVVGTVDLAEGASLPAWTATPRCEGCAVRRGLQEPREPIPPPAEPDPEEP